MHDNDQKRKDGYSQARWQDLAHLQANRFGLPPEDALSSALLKATNQHKAPVDLAEIVRHWPGLTVTVENIDAMGYLLDLGRRGGEILIRTHDTLQRRRFTLAHELGHWLLGSGSGSASCADSDPRIEKWCDRFAANLLMPSNWVYETISGYDNQTLASNVLGLPTNYQTSRAAMWRRIAECSSVSVIVRRWGRPGRPFEELLFTEHGDRGLSRLQLRRWAEHVERPIAESENHLEYVGNLVVSYIRPKGKPWMLIAARDAREKSS